MAQYLLSVWTPEGPQPEAAELAGIMRDVAALNEDMRRAGVWVFAGGLEHPSTATVCTAKEGRGGEVLLTDGPYVEGKEYLGGFTIIEAADLDAALEWGRRTAAVIGLPIEVRPFHNQF